MLLDEAKIKELYQRQVSIACQSLFNSDDRLLTVSYLIVLLPLGVDEFYESTIDELLEWYEAREFCKRAPHEISHMLRSQMLSGKKKEQLPPYTQEQVQKWWLWLQHTHTL